MRTEDVQLSRHFWLSELPGWEKYTDEEVEAVKQTVRCVVQPARWQFGAIRLTSGLYWSSGPARTGAHADPGTLDFVPLEATAPQVHDWIRRRVSPRCWGQLILEYHEKPHIHVTPWGLPINGEPRYGEVLIESESVPREFRFGRVPPIQLAAIAIALALAAALAFLAQY